MPGGKSDQFEVRLGRIRSPDGSRKAVGFFRKMRKSAKGLARRSGGSQQRFAARSAFHRRVVVKASIKRMGGAGSRILRSHLDYIERDGTGENGERAQLYSDVGVEADKESFVGRTEDDRHHFRFIVSPEDASELQSLTEYTRDLVHEMERDLGTKLDWVAADHFDTGQPHTHLIVRGKRDDGTDLVIPRDYIARGLRERAQGLAELELGPVSEIEGRNRMARMVRQDRLTAIDRSIFNQARDGVIDLSDQQSPRLQWKDRLARARLRYLSKLELAEPMGSGRWRIDGAAETTLKRMGERGDIIKAMHRAMRDTQTPRLMDANSIFDPSAEGAKPVTGAILSKGVADDVTDRGFIVIDSLEGKPVYVDVGGIDRIPEYAAGQIVTASPPNISPRPSDRTIAKIAAANNGRYSAGLHRAADKRARPEYVQSHIRRLEAMRRASNATREADGTWHIPSDYLARAAAFEKSAAALKPTEIKMHSSLRLAQMKTAIGATWLDKHLHDFDDMDGARGFAGEVQSARLARRRFLAQQGFAKGGEHRIKQTVLDQLEARDRADAGQEVSKQLSKSYSSAPITGRIDGIYKDAIDRPSGRYAIIERAKDFTLVPWRDVLERNRGKMVSGLIRGNSISWRLNRGRGIS